jgi:hypothetical protein
MLNDVSKALKISIQDAYGSGGEKTASTLPYGWFNDPAKISEIRKSLVGKAGGEQAIKSIDTFRSADTLYVFNENQSKLGTLDANNIIDSISVITANTSAAATGQAYGVRVSDGVIYQKGHFINVGGHTITVKDYDTNPNTYVVGFQTTETLVTPDMDGNLTDNALGYPNEKAPGAHRLQLSS